MRSPLYSYGGACLACFFEFSTSTLIWFHVAVSVSELFGHSLLVGNHVESCCGEDGLLKND